MSGCVSVVILNPLSFWPASFWLAAHKPEASEKSIGVVTDAAFRRQLLDEPCIAAAEDDIFRLQGGDEVRHDIRDVLPPFVLAQAVETPLADVVFKRGFFIRQVSEFHRLDDAVNDHRRAEAGAESEEQHLSFFIAP